MISFGTTYWFISIIAVLISSLAIVVTLYFRNNENKELSKLQVWTLMVLRFFSFFLISFLLLSPFLKNLKKIVQKPLIIIAWDNSKSMVNNADSVLVKTNLTETEQQLTNELGTKFNTIHYWFGENVSRGHELDFQERESNYSRAINQINENHYNENIGSLILIGDGIYNQGKNPANLAGEINFPVYTLAFGDTNKILDARIQTIVANRTAFSGNKFTVEVETHFSKLKNKLLQLSIRNENTELASTMLTPPSDDYFYTHQFILDAKGKGLKNFTAQIQISDGERNIKNNRAEFVINVLENQQKILIISEGYHPDIGALKNTLESQATYQVSVFTEEPYPANFSEFNLVIFNQLPSSGKSVAELISLAEKNRISTLFMVGSKTYLPQFNSLVPFANINPLAGSSMDEAQAWFNSSFASFLMSETFKENLNLFPPLFVPFANFELDPDFNTLLFQKIKNIETDKPIFALGKFNGIKHGIIFGEGIWRWRLFDYQQNQNHANFNEIINQSIQYLALRENEDNFMIDFQAVYNETENVVFSAEVYNDAFEPVNSEEISIKIKHENGEEFDFVFDTGNSGYKLNAGNLEVGKYSFSAEVKLGNETYTENGEFSVLPVNLEAINTQANHQMLFLLSEFTGGKFFYPQQKSLLINELNNNDLKSTSYFQEMITELLNLKAIFFVLLLFLSVEWFLRKYWGIY